MGRWCAPTDKGDHSGRGPYRELKWTKNEKHGTKNASKRQDTQHRGSVVLCGKMLIEANRIVNE